MSTQPDNNEMVSLCRIQQMDQTTPFQTINRTVPINTSLGQLRMRRKELQLPWLFF